MGKVTEYLIEKIADFGFDKFAKTFNFAGLFATVWAAITKNYYVAIILVLLLVIAGLIFWIVRKKDLITGITRVSKPHKISTIDSLAECKSSFAFMGVSAKNTADNKEVMKKLTEMAVLQNCSIKFLLMNPNDKVNIDLRSADEKDNGRSWINDMEGGIGRIQGLRSKGVDVKIKLYKKYPLWRMIFIDDKTLYLNYALNGVKLNSTGTLIINNQDGGIYHTYKKYFDQVWNDPDSVEV